MCVYSHIQKSHLDAYTSQSNPIYIIRGIFWKKLRNPVLAPRLSNKLEKCQNQLEECYSRLASILTDIQMEGLDQLHNTDPKMKQFLGKYWFPSRVSNKHMFFFAVFGLLVGKLVPSLIFWGYAWWCIITGWAGWRWLLAHGTYPL